MTKKMQKAEYKDILGQKLAHLNYTDPTNDVMTDYFGSSNSLLMYNGQVL